MKTLGEHRLERANGDTPCVYDNRGIFYFHRAIIAFFDRRHRTIKSSRMRDGEIAGIVLEMGWNLWTKILFQPFESILLASRSLGVSFAFSDGFNADHKCLITLGILVLLDILKNATRERRVCGKHCRDTALLTEGKRGISSLEMYVPFSRVMLRIRRKKESLSRISDL